MRCIFCKQPSDGSRSKEHIIPESFGNPDYVLSPGWVCDGCNNYLSRKVESPFLDSSYSRAIRFEMHILSKRDVIPPGIGLHPQSRSVVEVYAGKDGSLSLNIDPKDTTRFIEACERHKVGTLYLPAANLPSNDYETARFICKIALEVLAFRCRDVAGWNDEIVDKQELDEIRNYVRRGCPNFVWPIDIRRIYPAQRTFLDGTSPEFQVLNEFDLLFIPSTEMPGAEVYAIIAIFGVEYVVNLGGPELDGYIRWLKNNDGKSYLYSGKNARVHFKGL